MKVHILTDGQTDGQPILSTASRSIINHNRRTCILKLPLYFLLRMTVHSPYLDTEVHPKYVKWGVCLNSIALIVNLFSNALRVFSQNYALYYFLIDLRMPTLHEAQKQLSLR